MFQRDGKGISKWFVIGCLVIFLASTFTYACMHQSRPTSAQKTGHAIYVKVKPGMNADAIAAVLYEKKIIGSMIGFKIMAKLNGLDGHLRSGDYVFYRNMRYSEIIEILTKGRTAAFRVTVPEGYTIEQIARLLQEKDILSAEDFQREAEDFAPFAYIVKASRAKYSAEGFLFPDTYEFLTDASAKDIMDIMAKEFDKRFTPQMRARTEALNLTVEEVVTLASLVEKEAQVDDDRPIIAQVFINRLRAQMPLQSCATIQYILGHPKAELSLQDTEIESPYNTYQNMGLPPGPIANPGIASIEAVLFSQPTEYLYFVADKNGKHHFSRTYEEHLQAIEGVE